MEGSIQGILTGSQGDLQNFIQRYIISEVETEKQIQYAKLRRSYLYWDGKQYLVPVVRNGLVTDWEAILPPGYTTRRDSLSEDYDSRGRYDTAINVVRGDSVKFVAVLGNRSPNPKAVPLVESNIEAQMQANLANRICTALRKLWDVAGVHRKLMLHAWRDGTFFLYTPLERDSQGNAKPGLHPHTTYTVTFPFYAEEFDNLPWFMLQYEANKGEIVEQYPQLLEKIDTEEVSDTSMGQTGLWTRAMPSSQTGDVRKISANRWTFTQLWLEPCMYNFFASRQYQNMPLRDMFKQLFPRGVKLTLVGNEVIDMVPESYRDVWSCGQPGVSTTVMMDPVCTDFLPIQDALNNLTALNQESIERGIPIVAADPQVLNVDAINSRAGVPGELIAAEPGAGGRMKDAIINLPVAKYEPDVQNFSSMLLEIGRQLTGVMPPIFGGGDSGTAREADINKTQALMQLGIIWLGALSAWRGAYTNGVKTIAQFGGDVLRKFGLSEMDLQRAPMLVNEFGELNGFTIEVEESIPATWGQKKDSVMFMFQGGPEVMQVTGAADPANADKVQDIMGVPDWKTPGSGVRNFLLTEIKHLLSSGPQEPPPEVDPLTGQPLLPDPAAPLMPSIMPDPVVVEPMLALQIVRDWLTSDEGILQRDMNPEGWDNVRLYAQQLMQMTMPPPPPPGEGGPPEAAPEEPPMEEPMPPPGSMGPAVGAGPMM